MFVLLVILVLELWLAVWLLLPRFYPSGQDAGQLGDSFGAVTSLFSGLTLLGAGYAVWLQHQELTQARRDSKEAGEDRLEAQRAQRSAAELNAYDSLVRHYTTLASTGVTDEHGRHWPNKLDPMVNYQLQKYLQMTRVVLTEIQYPDVRFDWGDVPEAERTRFRRFFLCRLRENRARYLDLYREPLKREPGAALLRELQSELRRALNQEAMTDEDRRWARHVIEYADLIYIGLSKSPALQREEPEEIVRQLLDSFFLRFPVTRPR